LRREISSNQWEIQSCFQGAFDFFLLSFGLGGCRLEGRFFFSNVCGVENGLSRVDTGLSMQVLLGAIARGGRKGFIFLSANKRAQVRGG